MLLLIFPALVTRLLVGGDLTGAGLVVGRITGIALVSLGISCWPDRETTRAFYGMLLYSTSAMLYLIIVGIAGATGTLLWPAVVVHAGLCGLLLWARRAERRSANALTIRD